MPNRNYQRGRAFEYRVKYHLEKLGYYVVRSYASKGLFDLIAAPPYPPFEIYMWPQSNFALLVQCKTNGYIPPAERSALVEASKKYLGFIVIASKDKNGHIVFKQLNGSIVYLNK